MLKIITLSGLERIKDRLPEIVHDKIQAILSVLEKEYGADRNVDTSDGGFVLFVDSEESIAEIEKIISISKKIPEYVEAINTKYLNALYILTNEFGINVIIRKDIAPETILNEFEL